jgi:hypothetical protein
MIVIKATLVDMGIIAIHAQLSTGSHTFQIPARAAVSTEATAATRIVIVSGTRTDLHPVKSHAD